MPYEFEPRDLDDPRGRRDPAPATDSLLDAFEEWQARAADAPRREIGGSISADLYDLATDALDGVEVRADDATALVLGRGGDLDPTVGLFLSAAYNRAAEDVVFFDVDAPTPVEHLGFRLRREKTLVLDGRVGSTMAVDAAGLVVNRTAVDSYFGYSADGAFVNATGGSCLTFGSGAAAVSVNLGEITGASGSDAVVSLAGDGGDPVSMTDADLARQPELRKYLDRLADGLTGDRESVRAFLGGMDPSPRVAIERALRDRTEVG